MAEPLAFVGRPGALRGAVRVRAGERAVSVRGGEAELDALPGRVRAVAAAARVPAGTEQDVPVCIALDRATPPGRYAGRLTLAGQTFRILADVVAAPRLSLTPGRVDAAADRTELHAENKGNVPVDLPRLVAAGPLALRVTGPARLEVGVRAVLAVSPEPAAAVAAVPAGGPDRPFTVPFGPGTLRVTSLPVHEPTTEPTEPIEPTEEAP